MLFNPEVYSIPDRVEEKFIEADEIWFIISKAEATTDSVKNIISKSLQNKRLSLPEVGILLKADSPELIELIKEGARKLKQKVYGNRIVFFAPLYIGNYCQNDCKYCGFRASNNAAVRKTLSKTEIAENVKALEADGHKRLIAVFGEHPAYSADFIKETVETVYATKNGTGEIRRVNVNAAPFSVEDFKTIQKSGIGTYQIFQETYHKETYQDYHQQGRKADFEYRLTALDRAQLAGIDDVGIGVLFGLYDWRFEVMGLVRHVNHLESCFGVGPHTISFPRLQKASHTVISEKYRVTDEQFTRLVAILRLAVPYTGLILTARESEKIRDEAIDLGCSQIDAGTNIEIGAYANRANTPHNPDAEQFETNDHRSLHKTIDEILDKGYLPSFCTACYRSGRTGEHFMEYSVPGFIHNFCTPNSIFTFAEYLEDYGSENMKKKGYKIIEDSLEELEKNKISTTKLRKKIQLINNGKRDIFL